VLCRNVIVRNVKVHSFGPNNDGCDPECCTDVWIKDCEFNTGDDCIAIKSGRNRDGRRVAVASQNIVIQSCVMKDGHGGVTIGSEISGDVRHVYAEDCRMDSPHLDRVLRLKTNSVRGGVIEHIYMRNVQAGQVAGAVLDIDFRYEEGNSGKFKPTVRNIEMRDITCGKSKHGWTLVGYPDAPIEGVRLANCRFGGVERANVSEHVKGLTLDRVTINGVPAA
jgi:polygalacturonase